MTRASIESADPAGPADKAGTVTQAFDVSAAELTGPVESAGPIQPVAPPAPHRPVAGNGPVERVMSTVIRKLAWSRLADPRVAVAVAGLGLLLGISSAPRRRTPRRCRSSCRCRISCRRWRHHNVLTMTILYTRRHPRLPGAGRDAVGAQPGLAPQPASPAAGQRGRRRGHGEPHPGRLIGYRQLRGISAA